MKPICVGCRCFYRPLKNGFEFVEGMPDSHGAPRGVAGSGMWSPYKLWRGDLWGCPICGHRIVVGVGAGPASEHYMADFEQKLEEAAARSPEKRLVQVNDC